MYTVAQKYHYSFRLSPHLGVFFWDVLLHHWVFSSPCFKPV